MMVAVDFYDNNIKINQFFFVKTHAFQIYWFLPERKASKVIDVFHSRLEQAAIEQRCFILIVPTYMIIFSIEIYDKKSYIII